MFNKGEWVEFTMDGKTLKGFVLNPNIYATTIETMGKNYQVGQPYQRMSYNVPNYRIKLLGVEFLPQDKAMLIDMALASNNKGLFESLVGSLEATL